ncbi:unnamed protein product (macronuclear) [Paramecium tetraurelia]|uniref:Uncharacterized protein n=1 Tax=Paramecium tetraurelia TaxID=5888 RepID=A0D210_PARTE|nr:uncharacterized protein GSPATT00012583001 [Paramecium tetraurelia]CAK77077.1 unnamed protein product [Paramecium tetraurelia]|eukprot:XP_001444474.1 hypothetical protein (macronuclear) [Paramecium tetraurelia strain d4-2]
MKRYRNRRNVTVKREIVQKKNKFCQSFVNLESKYILDYSHGQTRRISCYGDEFGSMNKFQTRFKNILPEFKTKQSIHEIEKREKRRRQTQLMEDVAILKFRRGIQDNSKSKTIVQTLKMLKTSNQDFDEIVKQIKQPSKNDNINRRRRYSCYCTQCGKMSEKQIRHQNDPFFDKINKFLQQIKNQSSKLRRHKFQDKLKSHISQENIKISYVSQNKSPINKYKSVSRTTKLLLEQSQTKIFQYSQRYSAFPSHRVKTEPTQSSPRSFKLYPIQLNKLRQGQSTYKSIHLKDSFKTLASIYR